MFIAPHRVLIKSSESLETVSYTHLYDVIELRIDFYQEIRNSSSLKSVLQKLRSMTDLPILLTYRSSREGGPVSYTHLDVDKRQVILLWMKNALVKIYI